MEGDQKIALLYLCNEVMLTSKDKTSAFVVEFMEVCMRWLVAMHPRNGILLCHEICHPPGGVPQCPQFVPHYPVYPPPGALIAQEPTSKLLNRNCPRMEGGSLGPSQPQQTDLPTSKTFSSGKNAIH